VSRADSRSYASIRASFSVTRQLGPVKVVRLVRKVLVKRLF